MLVLSAADHVVLIYWVRSPDQDGRGDLWSFSPWGLLADILFSQFAAENKYFWAKCDVKTTEGCSCIWSCVLCSLCVSMNEFSLFFFLCSVSCSVWMLGKNVGHLSGRCIAGRSFVWVWSLGHKTSGKEAIRVVVFILQDWGERMPWLWTWKIRVRVKRGVGEGGRGCMITKSCLKQGKKLKQYGDSFIPLFYHYSDILPYIQQFRPALKQNRKWSSTLPNH